MKRWKPRNLFYLMLMIFCFPVAVSAGLSVFGGMIAAALFAMPLYFLCFVLRIPAWQISKHRKETDEIRRSRMQALDTAREIAQEGIVLLKNEESLLPLRGDTAEGADPQPVKLNVFGRCAIQTFFNGSGSAAADLTKCVTFEAALEEFGDFRLNEELFNLHKNYIRSGEASVKGRGKKDVSSVKMNQGGAEFLGKRPELALEEIPCSLFERKDLYEDGRSVLEHAREFSEYALVVAGRGGSEGFELKPAELRLSAAERELLEAVCRYFDKVVLVLNTSNPLELGCLEQFPQIKSVLWIGFPGSVGTTAAAQVLCGKVNPSGRLADTWTKDHFAAPACSNFQILKEDGSWDEKSYHLDNYKENQGYFLHYSENIYVGYKYFETRFRTDEGYRYEKDVLWPFGYGLSYTQFEQKIESFETEEEKILLTVGVKNVGACAGKEVVQIYMVPPYTGKIEKASVNLLAFQKTGKLCPGEHTEIRFEIPMEELASFDFRNEKSYVLEAGRYEICVMKNAHERIEGRTWELERDIIYKDGRDGKRPSDRTEAAARFADADTLGKDLTRSWDADSSAFTGPSAECFHAAEDVLRALGAGIAADHESGLSEEDYPETGVKYPKRILLDDMKGIPYDDERWDAFIRQMSVGEMCNICGNGAWHTEPLRKFGIPKRLMPDGTTCICSTLFSGIVMSNAGEGIIYPNPVVAASAWNPEIGQKMGRSVGKEAKALGYHGWYAPAVNCHRTHFNARNFEYYSEDGVLSGKMAAAVVSGAQAEGILCFIKHFALNEKESSGRNQLLTYCNEQALREIYLKPFEIAVKEGGAKGIMTAFNYIGNVWAGADPRLLEDVLRNEWGFCGVVSTDACVYPHMDVKKMLVSGGDLSLDSFGGFAGGNIKRVELLKAANDKKTRVAMTRNLQRACKNILSAFLAVSDCTHEH